MLSIDVITFILNFKIVCNYAPCSIGLQTQFDCRLASFECCTLDSVPINVWQPTWLCQDHSVIMRNACFCFEALTLSCEGRGHAKEAQKSKRVADLVARKAK